MFWLLCVISTIAYSVQHVLMTHHVRQMDAWSAAMYRNLSLGISMLPLLLWAGWEATIGVTQVFWPLLGASITGAVSLVMAFYILNFLPVGISSAFSSAVRTVGIIFIAWIFLGESLSLEMIALVGLILAASIWLGLGRRTQTQDQHLRSFNAGIGALYLITQGILVAIAFTLFAVASRQHEPLVVGYFWELMIGVLLLIGGWGRRLITKKKLEVISLKTFSKILLVCAPTLIGTGAFALAITLGPIGIASVISVGAIFVTAALSYFIYHEKPLHTEWIGMAVIALGIIGIKLIEL